MGDAYLGSRISLISNSEIRYEGVLFNINPEESTVALQNGAFRRIVRSPPHRRTRRPFWAPLQRLPSKPHA